MKILKPEKTIANWSRLLLIISFLYGISIHSHASSEKETVKINDNIKIKRASDGTVSLYSNSSGDKEEYIFTDFNADVVLLLYRQVELDIIIRNLSKKYYLSKTDTRRYVKMTINTLEQWNLVSRT